MKDSAAFVRESKEDFVCVNKIGLLPALLTGYLLNRKWGREKAKDALQIQTAVSHNNKQIFWGRLFFFLNHKCTLSSKARCTHPKLDHNWATIAQSGSWGSSFVCFMRSVSLISKQGLFSLLECSSVMILGPCGNGDEQSSAFYSAVPWNLTIFGLHFPSLVKHSASLSRLRIARVIRTSIEVLVRW